MSDLLGDVDIEFPKTVTGCHAEIRRLSELIGDADEQLDAKDEAIGELQDEIDEIEENGTVSDNTEQAVHSFLDEVERTGPLRFNVPQSDRLNQIIVRLHDVVRRQP